MNTFILQTHAVNQKSVNIRYLDTSLQYTIKDKIHCVKSQPYNHSSLVHLLKRCIYLVIYMHNGFQI